ncbi:3'-5' exonuclease [Paraburkholderia sp. A2RO-4L]|uniref:3'-5' exonuclease n=1 Tax=Paraburkholderia sp. A2RO-4L TaxID=3028374 RepID=UPI003DA85B1D
MFPNTIALAQRLAKPVVAFDLEHTGGAGEARAVTDFGAMLVTPEGVVTSYASLVKPPAGIEFNSYVCRLTGIYPHTVKDAPGWEKVLREFVLPYQHALWVGFNSRANDTPLMRKESLRLGHELAPFDQLDLMRVEGEGSLSKRLLKLVPDYDASGAHRGLKDADMTLTLLEYSLPNLTSAQIDNLRGGVLPRSKRAKRLAERVEKGARQPMDVSKFLVAPGVRRSGQPWSADEVLWVCRQYRGGKKTIEQLAVLNGRSPYGIACALHKEGVITQEGRDQYRRP